MTTPAAPPPSTGRRVNGEYDRRTLVFSALVLFGAIGIGIGAIALFADPGAPTPRATGEQAQPQILERPNQGTPPENPGDRGGWEQLAILGLIIVAVAGIGLVVIRGGGAKAKANRDAWKAAAATGEDGALEP